MALEIRPEPDDAERKAIAKALEAAEDAATSPYASAWREALAAELDGEQQPSV